VARLFHPRQPPLDRQAHPHRRASPSLPSPPSSVRVEPDPRANVLPLAQDEVDDSRTTLGYAVAELKKDIQAQFDKLPEDKKADFPPTKLAIFVGASADPRSATPRCARS